MKERTLTYASFGTAHPLSIRTIIQPASIFYHNHDFLEIVYVRSGSGMHRHAENDHPIRHGDCFSILPGDRHAYLPGSSLVIVNMCVHPSFFEVVRIDLTSVPGIREFISLEPLFRAETSFRHKLHLSPADQRRIEPVIDAMEKELSIDAPDAYIAAVGHFLCFTAFAGRRYRESVLNTERIRREFAGKSDSVDRAIAFIEEHMDEDIRLSDVAAAALLSRSRISSQFKKMTGLSPIDYLIKARIDEASRLLTVTKMSVTDIAYRVGFHDSNYFTRMFRKLCGRTPMEHRRGRLCHRSHEPRA